MNYKQAITTGKLLTYLILLLTGEIGDRGRKEKLEITVKRKKNTSSTWNCINSFHKDNGM